MNWNQLTAFYAFNHKLLSAFLTVKSSEKLLSLHSYSTLTKAPQNRSLPRRLDNHNVHSAQKWFLHLFCEYQTKGNNRLIIKNWFVMQEDRWQDRSATSCQTRSQLTFVPLRLSLPRPQSTSNSPRHIWQIKRLRYYCYSYL